jgi:hypothetical protein
MDLVAAPEHNPALDSALLTFVDRHDRRLASGAITSQPKEVKKSEKKC